MVRSVLLHAVCVAALCASCAGRAQEASNPAPAADAPNPIVTNAGTAAPTNAATTATPHHHRAISPEVAAQLAAATPKFEPAPPKPPPSDEDADLRDLDKPRNGIIRLPKFIVTQPRPAVLSERAVHTKAGLADIAMKRYLTETDKALNAFRLPLFGSSAESRAMTMYEEDERLKNMADLSDDAQLVGASDKAAGQYVKKQASQTFMRPGDFDWKPIGR